MNDGMTCACGERGGCGWISHLDGTTCSHSFSGAAVPLGWQRTNDGESYVCPSCAFIRKLRESGPFSPTRAKHRSHVASVALPFSRS